MQNQVTIFQPTKNAMQSGRANTKYWILKFNQDPSNKRYIEPLMGWTASKDTNQQIRLKFPTKEAAIAFAEKKGLHYKVNEPKNSTLKLRSYSENFTN